MAKTGGRGHCLAVPVAVLREHEPRGGQIEGNSSYFTADFGWDSDRVDPQSRVSINYGWFC